MNRPLFAILFTVGLDAMGIGLIMPILPGLLRAIGQDSTLTWQFGALISLYAAMQFVCAPVLGAFGDRFGRRPVLLVSLAGATADYLMMAFAPSLWLLFVTRAIAGITGANMAVASAYITDITPQEQRSRRFGLLSACFGVGFIAGPALGGMLGAVSLRYPFLAAALLNGLNLLLVWLVLPETRRPADATAGFATFNPLAPLRWALGFTALLPLILTFVIFALVGEVGGTIWVLYGQDKFGWDTATLGLSLAGFGLFHAGAQAFVTGPVNTWLGDRRTLFVAMACDALAYVLIALATAGWMAFALLPLFCLGGIGAPVLQSMLADRVDAERQGELQGVLASLTSLASIGAPLLFSLIYVLSRTSFPGLVWMMGAALYLLCLPLLLRSGTRAGA